MFSLELIIIIAYFLSDFTEFLHENMVKFSNSKNYENY